MSAYDNNPWSSLFFVIFIIVCMYIFVSIFLAVVYKNYRKHLKVKLSLCFSKYCLLCSYGGVLFPSLSRIYFFNPFHFFVYTAECPVPLRYWKIGSLSNHRLSQSLRLSFPVPLFFPQKTQKIYHSRFALVKKLRSTCRQVWGWGNHEGDGSENVTTLKKPLRYFKVCRDYFSFLEMSNVLGKFHWNWALGDGT